MISGLNSFTNFSTAFYQSAMGDKDGDDLPAGTVPKPKAAAANENIHDQVPMQTITIPGGSLRSPGGTEIKPLAINILRMIKANPSLKELRLAYDPITVETDAQKIGEIDRTQPNRPEVSLSPTDTMRSTKFKTGDKYSMFSNTFGIDPFIDEFVNQKMTHADDEEAGMASYVEGAQDRSVDPFTNDYNLVFTNPEPGVLEIDIVDA